ncbi:helix-turn-helix domain-containing protein, partial [Microbispora sp. ATCC PTA-5024]|uniref:helix-turn-helix domain-containing protein n=1 Tax=Microbispora sp. ATCC PTA-5024 TaxID=316330 RepID=UPI0005628ACA
MAGSGADKEFARRLRGLKERSGRSYEELARSAFVSSSTLHRYCSGRSVPPDIGVVVRVAKECGAGSQELQELLRAWAAAEAERRPADARAATPAATGTSAS